MTIENDEVVVIYFAICDHVLTEAGTSKQSLIGIYSGLVSQQFPMYSNLSVGVGIRLQSTRQRDITFSFTGPDGKRLFDSPPLPANWDNVKNSMEGSGFAALQIGVNVRSILFDQPGIYTAALYCDGNLLSTYPLAVQRG